MASFQTRKHVFVVPGLGRLILRHEHDLLVYPVLDLGMCGEEEDAVGEGTSSRVMAGEIVHEDVTKDFAVRKALGVSRSIPGGGFFQSRRTAKEGADHIPRAGFALGQEGFLFVEETGDVVGEIADGVSDVSPALWE